MRDPIAGERNRSTGLEEALRAAGHRPGGDRRPGHRLLRQGDRPSTRCASASRRRCSPRRCGPSTCSPGDGERRPARSSPARGGDAVRAPPLPRAAADAALLTDLYELTMAAAYLADGNHGTRHLRALRCGDPARRDFLVAAGLEDALTYLEGFRFDEPALAYLGLAGPLPARVPRVPRPGCASPARCGPCPRGRSPSPQEPLLRVTAPIIEAQMVETFLLERGRLPDPDRLQGGPGDPRRRRAGPGSTSGPAAPTAPTPP